MSTVQLAVRAGGGLDWVVAVGGAGLGSSFTVMLSKKDRCGEIVAELDGASGSYATRGTAGGRKGFAFNNHLICSERLFLGGITASQRSIESLHLHPTRRQVFQGQVSGRRGGVVGFQWPLFASRVSVALSKMTNHHAQPRDHSEIPAPLDGCSQISTPEFSGLFVSAGLYGMSSVKS